jgi:hypothetical protein
MAANALGLVDRDAPIIQFFRGARRAYIYTGCVGAMVAEYRLRFLLRQRILPNFVDVDV